MHCNLRTQEVSTVFVLGAIAWFPLSAFAQLPQTGRPIQIIVAAAAGGPSDFIARLAAPRLGEALHQTIIIENRASANGVAAAEMAARAAPDGSVLMVGNSGTHAINAALYRKLPYDPERDFAPITQMVSSPMVLVATPRLGFNSVGDLIAFAQKNPGKLNVAIPGASGQLAGEALKAQMKISMHNIPYKGGTPATFAVMAGESDLAMLTAQNALTQIAAGKLKALGVTSARRSPVLPTVPAIAEAGVDDYDFTIWHGLFAPARTPDALVRRVNREIVRILNLPEVKDRVAPEAYEVVANSPDQFAEVIKSQVARYKKIVAEAGIPLE